VPLWLQLLRHDAAVLSPELNNYLIPLLRFAHQAFVSYFTVSLCMNAQLTVKSR
jgi:hypothetical protein